MDNSELYAKMCEKAEEIQRDLKVGDYWCWLGEKGVYIATAPGERKSKYGRRTWLPRQDQLQGMLLPSRYREKYAMCSAFAAYLHDKPDVMSMEQLWLAFVMQEKYNKIWDGEDWING